MKPRRHFLGRIKNPTWKDYFVRVGGAFAAMVVVILVSRALIPGYEGIAVIVVSLALIAFLGIQEVRQGMREETRGRG